MNISASSDKEMAIPSAEKLLFRQGIFTISTGDFKLNLISILQPVFQTSID